MSAFDDEEEDDDPNTEETGKEIADGIWLITVKRKDALTWSYDVLNTTQTSYTVTLALGDGLRLRLAEKLVAELDAGVVLYSSIKLVAGSSETPLVVANSWSHAHEVDVAVMDADTAVAPHLRESATRRRSADF